MPGVVEGGLPDAPTLDLAPGVEILLAGDVTIAGGGEADTPQVVTMQVGQVAQAVPHGYRAAPKGIILFLDPSAVLFPLAQVEGGDAIPGAVDPVGIGIVAILLLHPIYPGDTTGLVVIDPGVSAVVPAVRLPLVSRYPLLY